MINVWQRPAADGSASLLAFRELQLTLFAATHRIAFHPVMSQIQGVARRASNFEMLRIHEERASVVYYG